MFTEWDKAIVAVIMGILIIVEQVWGYQLGITAEWLTSVLAILTPIFVWLVPNRRPEDS